METGPKARLHERKRPAWSTTPCPRHAWLVFDLSEDLQLPCLQSNNDSLCCFDDSQLSANVVQMMRDGLLGYRQDSGSLPRAFACSSPGQNLAFTRRQSLIAKRCS